MASGGDGKIFTGISATTAAFPLLGGVYGITASATWGGGSVALQTLAADGTTWVQALSAFTSNGYATISLAPGQYRFSVSTASAVYLALARAA